MEKISAQLNNLKKEALECKNCELFKTRNKIVFSDGCENAPIMFIGEAPGQNEDETGIPFIGRAGQLLRKFLFEIGIKQDDIYIANTIKCRPPKNRKPTGAGSPANMLCRSGWFAGNAAATTAG